MRTIEQIIEICNKFKERKYDIEEFQSRLQTLLVDDEVSQYISSILHDVDNELEEIRFCRLEENFYTYGIEVAESLIERVKRIQV